MITETQEDQFSDTPGGWYRRWVAELDHAKRELEPWHKAGEQIVKRFRDDEARRYDNDCETRWNLFSANVQTQRALLYGNTPRVSVDRRFADAADDVARVAAEILQRVLNADIEKDSDTYAVALDEALQDFLIVGLGLVRVRYVAEFETDANAPPLLNEESGEEEQPERKVYECAEVDYLHWRDVRWSPARVWQEVRWLAFRAEMGRADVAKRFGEDVAKRLPYNTGKSKGDDKDGRKPMPWSRAEVWEIWDKETRQIFWVCEGYNEVLEQREDTLGLDGFFPCPRPMRANWTTNTVTPRPDYALAQDLYRRIDDLSTRCTLLEDAIAVRGVYDASMGDLENLVTREPENRMFPVKNWAALAEKGGLRGVVDWLPLEQLVAALTQLQNVRQGYIDALYQITGMSDIMRGQASDVGATATEQSIKAKFGSVRMQALQLEFARFASDAQRIKAEIMAKHFDAATLLAASNIQYTPDRDMALPAMDMLLGPVDPVTGERNRKASRFAMYRVQVKPEVVSLQDFAALRSESNEVITGLATYMQAMGPLAQQMPGSLPYLLELLQVVMARIKGGSDIEGILDRAIAGAQQAAQQPQQAQQDPKLPVQQAKAQADLAKVQAESQARLMEIQAETQAAEQQERAQARWNLVEAQGRAALSQAQRAQQHTSTPGGAQ